MTINYVVPCWSGNRRLHDPEYEKNPAYYLEEHLDRLKRFKHSLNQITLVINLNPQEPKIYTDFLNQLPAQIGTAKLVILRRDSNLGMTFGAWSYVYDLYRDSFDYYLFSEDDYVPNFDDFDKILTDAIGTHTNCGFQSAGPVVRGPGYNLPIYAIGVIPSSCLEVLKSKYSKLPYAESEKYSDTDLGSCFHAIGQSGFSIEQLHNYGVGVLHHAGSIGNQKIGQYGTYGDGPLLFIPVQHARGLI